MRRYCAMGVSICILGSASAMGGDATTEPKELVTLRTQYETRRTNALTPILAQYKQSLERLEKQLSQRNDLEGALAARAEREKIIRESLASQPRRYISEEPGFAGSVTRNNVYTFSIESTGSKAILRYWASGDSGLETYGNVFLIPPSKQEILIGSWTPQDCSVPANSVNSWKRLREKEIDITGHMSAPGDYGVAFKHTSGWVGLAILRVELSVEP